MSEALNTIDQQDYDEAAKSTKVEFKIDSLKTAVWAGKMLHGITAKRQEIADIADEQRAPYQEGIDKINDWQKSENDKLDQNQQFFEDKLAEYLTELRKTDKKAKISTPDVTVSTRKSQGINYNDAEVLTSLSKQDIDGFTKQTLEKAQLKKSGQFKDGKFVITDGDYAGMVIDGITQQEEVQKVTFRYKGGK